MRARSWLHLATTVLVCLVAADGVGQSLLREEGEFGAAAAATFIVSRVTEGLGVEGVWTGWGVLDVAAGYARYSIDSSAGVAAPYTQHQAGLQLSYLVRQTEARPVSVQLGVGLTLLTFTGDALGGLDLDGHAPAANATVARRFELRPDLGLVPFVAFTFGRATVTTEADGVEVAREGTDIRQWDLGAHLLLQRDVFLAPRLMMSKGEEPMYALTAGFMFPPRR